MTIERKSDVNILLSVRTITIKCSCPNHSEMVFTEDEREDIDEWLEHKRSMGCVPEVTDGAIEIGRRNRNAARRSRVLRTSSVS